MKTLWTYIKPKIKMIGLGFGIKFIGTVIELLLPWILAIILNRYAPAGDWDMTRRLGLLMLLCSGLALAANVTANRLATKTARDIIYRLRQDLFSKVLKLSCRQADELTEPSLISRITSDTYNVYRMLDRMQRMGVRAPIMLFGGVAITMVIEPVLTLILLAILPILATVVWQVSRRGTRRYEKTQEALDGLIRRAQESMAGIRVIKALSKDEYEKSCFDKINKEVVQTEKQATLLMNITGPVMNFLLNAGLTLVVVVGAFRVNRGLTQTGTIIAFLSYFTLILIALMAVSRLFTMYSKGAASARRIAEVLAAEEIPMPAADDRPGESGQIVFEAVSFSYDKVRNNLTEISFVIEPGQTLGIIGPTGSGKSTLLRLLLRFYVPDSGCIRLDGRDIQAMPAQELYARFGTVLQNDFLYAAAMKDNISLGRRLKEEDLQLALQTAQADFIREKEGGLAYEIAARGHDISGGQKQRLLLARALAAKPPILLLDDSSSALDFKTDACLRSALAEHFAAATKIIVAQRISSIKHADQILVLQDGRVIGQGSHSQLMKSCAYYREAAAIQMGEE
ncbi:ABC transporter ATP-binding protein [Lachnospiraceae bacterium oral taxon 500]|nr:ABC transporter ATP-binding protein [Lachnospiraceae bacterium oral taxon 500]